jgi:hypothetical protein
MSAAGVVSDSDVRKTDELLASNASIGSCLTCGSTPLRMLQVVQHVRRRARCGSNQPT